MTTEEQPRRGWELIPAGLMLGLMAGWVYAAHEPTPMAIVAVLVGAGLAAIVVGYGQLRRRTSAFLGAAFGLGIVAAGCAIWLAMEYRLESLGEGLGLGLFAILMISAGVSSRLTRLSDEERWSRVLAWRGAIGVGLAALGAISLGMFFYLALIEKVGAGFAPELIGLLFGGFILFFGGMYLLFTGDPPPSIDAVRLFFIMLGSILGSFVALVAVARAILWNAEIFRSGVAAFHGPESWRFWLVAYLFLAGLGLIFASLSLSRSQVRASPELRRATFGYGSVVAGLLAFILLGFANLFIAQKVPYTYNWSATRGLTALNAGSKNLLASLTEPVGVYVLMTPNNPLYNDIRNFVGNTQAYTNRISVQFIDPKNDPRKYNELATRFKEIEPDARSPFEPANQGVLLVYGPLPEDVNRSVPHSFIPEKRLYEIDQKAAGKGKATLILKAEGEIMKELAFLAKKSDKQKIYFYQGDGALDIGVEEATSRRNLSFDLERLGAGKLVDKLRKDNFDVRGLSFSVPPAKDAPKDVDFLGKVGSDKKPNVPDDCDVLILPGPSLPIAQPVLDAFERYMDRGGKMIAAVDVVAEPRFTALRRSGLEDFLKKYGVDVSDKILFRRATSRDVSYFGGAAADPRLVLAEAPAKPATLLAKQLQGMPLRWWSARIVRPGTSAKYRVEPLLIVDPRRSIVWADDDLLGTTDFNRYVAELNRTGRLEDLYTPEQIPVAVTVSEGAGETGKPRMVVFGDSEFMSNDDVRDESNFDLIASSIEWMSERGFIGPRPKETSTYTFGPNANLNIMVFGSIWTMVILIVLLGIAVWLARRK